MNEYQNKYDFQVTWSPFLLRPQMPLEGVEKPANYSSQSAGSQALIATGQSVGIDFTYKSTRFPNTLAGHCALEYALKQDPNGTIQSKLQENLFKSYFTDGKHLSVSDVVDVAASAGLNRSDVEAYITNVINIEQIKEKALQWSAKGVTGVPAFIMNGKMTFSGAQEPQLFKQMFDTIISKFGSS